MSEDFLPYLESIFKPYGNIRSFKEIPKEGLGKQEIFEMIKEMIAKEDSKWKQGLVSGAVYHGGEEHVNFLNSIYSLCSQVNPLHPDIWPSVLKFESEIISMVSKMLHGGEEIVGSVTSGGTESIILAMKAYRDHARKVKGILEPEVIIPSSAHAAFDKASQYLGLRLKYVELDENFKADLEAIKREINERTVAIVASAPCFPYGTIDPIEEISEIALDHKIALHVDACLGGFILPWAKKLGYNVPKFDFELEGVTSISVDPHKYGYAPKGVSVILYRDPEIWKKQFYINTNWRGGVYFSTTIQGSKPGALMIAAWAAMLSIGERGYLEYTKKILEIADFLKSEIRKIDELKILGAPLWVIAISSDSLDIYKVADFMGKKGWNLNILMKPPAFHIALTLRHDKKVIDKFIEDLKNSVFEAKSSLEIRGLSPIYGMMSALPLETSEDLISSLIYWLYKNESTRKPGL